MSKLEPDSQPDEAHTSKQKPQSPKETASTLLFFFETLLLFTRSDLKTFVIPETAFGLVGALSGPVMTTNKTSDLLSAVSRIPHVLLWTWLNALLFTISNQRLPDAIKEDAINKPSRPLPSARITPPGATRLLLLGIPLVSLLSIYLGAAQETVLLTCLNWMYNELGGSDDYLGRSILIAATYACYCAGAVQVASGPGYTMNRAAYQWIAVIAGIIFTTMAVQDLKDQEGDRARGRRTLPLVVGDRPARWTVAIPVLVWSILCPTFWSLQPFSFAITMSLGLGVAVRVLWRRGSDADRFTWKLWCLWLSVLYLLPLFKNPTALSRFWAIVTV